jgi:uncharacterized protein
MPVTPTYPGVYIEEIPDGAHPIMGVPTSITAFVGRAFRGPTNDPIPIQSFFQFEKTFGGLWAESTMSYAVQHFLLNGGSDALIVRIINGGATASFTLASGNGTDPLILEASSPGAWANNLRISVDYDSQNLSNELFNLIVEIFDFNTAQIDRQNQPALFSEAFRDLSCVNTDSRYIGKVLEEESRFLRVPSSFIGMQPASRPALTVRTSPSLPGDDGSELTHSEYEGDSSAKTGIYALLKADLFNLLCIPPFTRDKDVEISTLMKAADLCHEHRALLILDPRNEWSTPADIIQNLNLLDPIPHKRNAAVYFPWVKALNPSQKNMVETFVPCGVVAGVMARTDAQRGVWKAPAGTEAGLIGISDLSVHLSDAENEELNPLGVNTLRSFHGTGLVVWGARTLEGADSLASEWKYVPVRRLALFIEESLYRGTQWAVFEPNAEPLWSELRLNVGAFLRDLFRKGAFQGSTPREAYFVKCDAETTTAADIGLGIVNIVVGFAPLKPAEFVIIQIQQIVCQCPE